jgi:hypothetical protein
MRKSGVKQADHGKQKVQVAILVALVTVMMVAVLLSSRGTQRAGSPKRIEADGVTYVACEGALWLSHKSEAPNDNEPETFYVRFRDAQGVDHELKRVRALRVTDLPVDTPECANSR